MKYETLQERRFFEHKVQKEQIAPISIPLLKIPRLRVIMGW